MENHEYDEYNDPREALKYEASRVPEIQAKTQESRKWTSVIRAARVADGLDAKIRDALGSKPA